MSPAADPDAHGDRPRPRRPARRRRPPRRLRRRPVGGPELRAQPPCERRRVGRSRVCSQRSSRSARGPAIRSRSSRPTVDARLLIPLVAAIDRLRNRIPGASARTGSPSTRRRSSRSSPSPHPTGAECFRCSPRSQRWDRWDAAARPVPADGVRTALAAADDDTDLIVIDPGSETEFVLRRPAVWAIAQGIPWEPSFTSPEVFAGLQAEHRRRARRPGPRRRRGRPHGRGCAVPSSSCASSSCRGSTGRARHGAVSPRQAVGRRRPHRGARRLADGQARPRLSPQPTAAHATRG